MFPSPATKSTTDKTLTSVSKHAHSESTPGLGEIVTEHHAFFRRRPRPDPSAVATLPSVYDDPATATQFWPTESWDNFHRFDPSARWTWAEEYEVIRKIDLRIMTLACLMFMALELDRSNQQQALSDNLLEDLHMTSGDYNLGNTLFRLAFLFSELPSQLLSKKVGPDRWIPMQMIMWSAVAMAQFGMSGRASYLAFRFILGFLQGGFIPDVILYLSYFYKHHELSLRLAFFWSAEHVADIISSFLAVGLLRLRGVGNRAGWRCLFLIEGLMTLLIGAAAAILMPAGPCQTASPLRGKAGWFSPREETILVNRIIRDDPSKGGMHNREHISVRSLWKSLCDYDLWPLYLIGLTFQTPITAPTQYLTLTLRRLGFSTLMTNLLTIPSQVLGILMLLFVTYISEATKQLTFVAMVGQIWALPLVLYLFLGSFDDANRWLVWAVMTLLLGFPDPQAIQAGWTSRNSNAVRSRTTSAAIYNMFHQSSGIIASNIYHDRDASIDKKGSGILVALVVTNIVIYLLTKLYYVLRNRYRLRIWSSLSEEEKLSYLEGAKDQGNKRLDFQLAH